MFFVWLYWLYLLSFQFDWNLIQMYTADNHIYWRAFVLVSGSFTLFLASLIFGFNNDQDKLDCSSEGNQIYQYEKEHEKDE